MSQSLKVRLKKLEHDGKITEAELEELMKKLDGHDVVIYNRAIDDFEYACVQLIKKEQDTRYGYLDGMDIREIAKQLKGGGKNG